LPWRQQALARFLPFYQGFPAAAGPDGQEEPRYFAARPAQTESLDVRKDVQADRAAWND